jgi:phosphomannomutase/phosphoglucomutase
MFFGEDYYGFDDAILATLRLLSIVARDARPLSRQLADVPRMEATPELRIDCPDEQKFEVVEIVKRELAAAYSIVDIDGVRVLFERGWGLVRASNTQPALVMRVEAQSVSDRDEYRGRLEASVARARRRVESGN